MLEIILVQGFCPLKIKITQYPNGFRLKKIANGVTSHANVLWARHAIVPNPGKERVTKP